jgi:2-polyprenyl-6-methoxyphenol hydroxylase-like FAD-dependent oxidoreductase
MTVDGADRVLVAGAGIGGLGAAAALRRRGIEVEVFERAPAPVPERGTGLTVWANAIRILDGLGCGDQVRDQGGLVERTQIRSAARRTLIDTPIAALATSVGAPGSYVVRRRDLLQALYDVRGDTPVHLGRECVGYRVEGSTVVLRLADGAEVRGRALICADGARSALRRQLLDDGDAVPLGSAIWRGISPSGPGLPPGIALLIWGRRGGGIGGGEIRDGQISWTIATNSAVERELAVPGADPKAVLQRFVAGLDATLEKSLRRTDPADIISAHVLTRKPSASWGQGPVTLLGDAAHAMPTAFGQGGCQALEDAAVLAHELSTADRVEAGLRRYEQRRQERISWLRERVERVDRFSRIENPVLCKLRDVVVPHVPTSSGNEMWRKIMSFDTEE